MITLRPLEEPDIKTVFALDQATPEAPHWPIGEYEALLQPSTSANLFRKSLIAEFGDTIAGFAVASLLLDGVENLCELESVVVRANNRRQGIGIVLLRAIAGWVASQGGKRLILEVRASNTAAISLYERAGLRQEGLRRGYYSAPQEDAVLLGMDISQDFQSGGKLS